MKITVSPGCTLGTMAEFDLVAPFYPGLERLVFGTHLDDARQTFLLEILQGKPSLVSRRREWPFLKIIEYTEIRWTCQSRREKLDNDSAG